MRGTLFNYDGDVVHAGIIPAYAGNTFIGGMSDAKNRDHPRVCGEHVADESDRMAEKGSSPRMRGTH